MSPDERYNLKPLVELAKAFGYTRDHLAFLCRKGEIRGEKVGRGWMASFHEVEQYQKRVNQVQEKRWDKLSEKQSLNGNTQVKTVKKVKKPKLSPVILSELERAKDLRGEKKRFFVRLRRTQNDRGKAQPTVEPFRVPDFGSLLRGGLYKAIESFQIAFKLFALPAVLAAHAVNLVLRAIYFLTKVPAASSKRIAKFFRLAHGHQADLYEKYRGQHSYWQLGRLTRASQRVYAGGLSVFIGLAFTFAASNMLGVPMSKINQQIAAVTDPAINLVLGDLEDRGSHLASSVIDSYLEGRNKINQLEQLVNAPAKDSKLVQDYLQAGVSSNEQIAYFVDAETPPSFQKPTAKPSEVEGQVAGAFTDTATSFFDSVSAWSNRVRVRISNTWEGMKAEYIALWRSHNIGDYTVVYDRIKDEDGLERVVTEIVKRELANQQIAGPVGSIPGSSGATGSGGAQGNTGSQGAQGLAGPQGPQGPQGERGSQGLAGSTGPAGTGGSGGGTTFFVGAPGATAKDGAGIAGSFKFLSAQEASIDNDLSVGDDLAVSGNSTLQETTASNLTTNSLTVTGTITSSGTQSQTNFSDSTADYIVGITQSGTGTGLRFLSSPNASSTIALLQLTDNPMSGGSANGTFIASNPQTFFGDFLRFQVGDNTRFVVDYAGATTIAGNLTVSTTTASSTIAHSLIVDTSSFVVNANNNRVGVGTANPRQTLDVVGSFYNEGSATTTGTYIVSTSFGVGTTTLPYTVNISGDLYATGFGSFNNVTTTDTVNVGGELTVDGTSTSTIAGNLQTNGDTTIGNSSLDTLIVEASLGSNLIPNSNATLDLGSTSFYWDDLFIDNVTANNLSAASSTISGTQAETFTINTNNSTSDTEDATLVFFRGTVTPNALLRWNSTADRFELTQDLLIQDETPSTGATELTIKAGAGQGGANLVAITDSSDVFLAGFTASGGILQNISSTTALTLQDGSGGNVFVVAPSLNSHSLPA